MIKASSTLAIALIGGLSLTASLAQAAPAGSALSGLCLVSQRTLLSETKVAQSANARYQQLINQAQASLAPEGNALQKQADELNAQRSKLAPAVYEQRGNALNARFKALQARGLSIKQQLDLTQRKAAQMVAADIQPSLEATAQSQGCVVTLDRDLAVTGGASLDIPQRVLQAVDARVTSVTFDLEPPPPPAAGR